MLTWDILICSIPHRRETLLPLLEALDEQIQPGVAARVCYDNLESSYGSKCDALLRSSKADYVSWVDDDDMVDPDFISLVMCALDTQPDYVGFPVKYTVDGELQMPVEHSLRHEGWIDDSQMLKRDIVHFNPIRRDLANIGLWSGGWMAERGWAAAIRDSGQCVNEAWIDKPVYWYQNRSADNFQSSRYPLPADQVLDLPKYDWLIEVSVL